MAREQLRSIMYFWEQGLEKHNISSAGLQMVYSATKLTIIRQIFFDSRFTILIYSEQSDSTPTFYVHTLQLALSNLCQDTNNLECFFQQTFSADKVNVGKVHRVAKTAAF